MECESVSTICDISKDTVISISWVFFILKRILTVRKNWIFILKGLRKKVEAENLNKLKEIFC